MVGLRFGLAIGAFVAIPIAANSNEALAKEKTAFARLSFSQWQAMPLHNNFGVTPGDFIDVFTEEQILASSLCFPTLETANNLPSDPQILDLRLDHETSSEIGFSGKFDTLSASAKTSIERETRNSARTLVIRSSDTYPQGGTGNIQAYLEQDPRCDEVVDYFYSPTVRSLLVTRVSGGSMQTAFEMSEQTKKSIEAEVPLKQIGIDVGAGAATGGTSLSAAIVSRPRGSLAIQVSKINVSALRYIYALKEDRPDTWVRLERLVDGYITGTTPDPFDTFIYNLRGFLENLESDIASIDDLYAALFLSKGAEPVESFASLEIPQDVWNAVGVYAAAMTVLSEVDN